MKKQVQKDMAPVGHAYEAVTTFKQYCGKNTILCTNMYTNVTKIVAIQKYLLCFQNRSRKGKNANKHRQGKRALFMK